MHRTSAQNRNLIDLKNSGFTVERTARAAGVARDAWITGYFRHVIRMNRGITFTIRRRGWRGGGGGGGGEGPHERTRQRSMVRVEGGVDTTNDQALTKSAK